MTARRQEQGAVLVVGLIMLVLLTMVLVGTYVYSTGNSRAVGNQQFRQEALAAANQAIERIISSPFTDAPAAEEITVDLNGDGVFEYRVAVDAPTCITVIPITQASASPSSVTLGAAFAPTQTSFVLTEWNIHATARDASGSGAVVEVNQGIRT